MPHFQTLKDRTLLQFRQRILVGDLASNLVSRSYEGNLEISHSDLLLEGFFEKKRLTINYAREDGEQSERKVEIHYLFLNWPIWYLIAWDHLQRCPSNVSNR